MSLALEEGCKELMKEADLIRDREGPFLSGEAYGGHSCLGDTCVQSQ